VKNLKRLGFVLVVMMLGAVSTGCTFAVTAARPHPVDDHRSLTSESRYCPSYFGLGGRLEDHTVVWLSPGGPAAKGGLRIHDVVETVGGSRVSGLTDGQIAQLIRGPSRTAVVLGIYRPGTGERFSLELTRGCVWAPPR